METDLPFISLSHPLDQWIASLQAVKSGQFRAYYDTIRNAASWSIQAFQLRRAFFHPTQNQINNLLWTMEATGWFDGDDDYEERVNALRVPTRGL